MSDKIRQELSAARESLDRTLRRAHTSSDAMVDECIPALDEIERVLKVLPELPKEELADVAHILYLSLGEIRYRIRTRPRKEARAQ